MRIPLYSGELPAMASRYFQTTDLYLINTEKAWLCEPVLPHVQDNVSKEMRCERVGFISRRRAG